MVLIQCSLKSLIPQNKKSRFPQGLFFRIMVQSDTNSIIQRPIGPQVHIVKLTFWACPLGFEWFLIVQCRHLLYSFIIMPNRPCQYLIREPRFKQKQWRQRSIVPHHNLCCLPTLTSVNTQLIECQSYPSRKSTFQANILVDMTEGFSKSLMIFSLLGIMLFPAQGATRIFDNPSMQFSLPFQIRNGMTCAIRCPLFRPFIISQVDWKHIKSYNCCAKIRWVCLKWPIPKILISMST